MLDFKIIYYIALVMFVLLIAIIVWGWFMFAKPKTSIRFLNLKLLIPTLTIGVIGLILSVVPIFMQVWTYDANYVKSDTTFLVILVFEYIFLVTFLMLAYIFSFDFGMAIDENNIYFFGQNINTNKIVALDQKNHVLKIVYEQGIKKIRKRLTIITPQAQLFIKKHLAQKVVNNANLHNVVENANVSQSNKDNDK